VERVAGCGIRTGLILGGSVRRGCERPDSDLDFFAVGEPGLDEALPGFAVVSEKNGCRVLESREADFTVHIAYWTTDSLERVLHTVPYMLYPLLDGEVVHDPGGLAARYRYQIRRYFDARPGLKRAWERQLDDLRRFRGGEIKSLAFPQWSDFIRHIEAKGLNRPAEPARP